MLHSVIMAGGSGTRFWPQSRKAMPKQLLSLTGEKTMIQQAVGRTADWVPVERTWVVTNEIQASTTREQLSQLAEQQFIIEPCGRNTAPCIGLAAIMLLHDDPDATMLVMPADHVIQNQSAFQQAVQKAEQMITEKPEAFVLFGIRPSYPATGFGYIEQGQPLEEGLFGVQSFREKPDQPTAEQFLESNHFYWNCGIFVWRADRILAALKEFEPETFTLLQKLQKAIDQEDWNDVLAEVFPKMNSISVDYAVLERAKDVYVLEAPFDWDDLGSWQALARLSGTDQNGHTVDATFCSVESTGCIVHSTAKNHLITALGVDDLIIVHTPDATLVARKDDENGIKQLVAKLKEAGYDDKL